MRGASTHWRQRAEAVGREFVAGGLKTEPAKHRLLATRREVVRGWSEVADDLVLQGQVELALDVRQFVKRLPPARTEREWVRDQLLEPSRTRVDQERHR